MIRSALRSRVSMSSEKARRVRVAWVRAAVLTSAPRLRKADSCGLYSSAWSEKSVRWAIAASPAHRTDQASIAASGDGNAVSTMVAPRSRNTSSARPTTWRTSSSTPSLIKRRSTATRRSRNPAGQTPAVGWNRSPGRCRIFGIVAGHDAEHERHIGNRPRNGADMVQ